MSKYKSENPIFKIKQNLYKINAGTNKAIYTHQMRKIIEQVENMLSWHRRVFIVVFDLHVDKFSLTNKQVSELIGKVRHYVEKYYKVKRFGYCWCREQHTSNKQHYHMAVMLDGAKINFPHKLLGEILKRWKEIIPNGTLHTPKNCYYMTDRKDASVKLEAIYRLSYQAKVKTKDKNSRDTKDYATSRIKAKDN